MSFAPAILLVLVVGPPTSPTVPAQSTSSEAESPSTDAEAPTPEATAPRPLAIAGEPATAPEALTYPLGPLPVPDFVAPGQPFMLTDLSYGLDAADSETTHAFAARVRYKSWGYIGAESSGERRGLSLQTHRFVLSAFDERGDWDLAAGFRGRRLAFSTRGRWRGATDDTWRVEPHLSFRITPDIEAEAWTAADTDRPADRLVTEMGTGLFWQRGRRLAARLGFVRRYDLIDSGLEGHRDENRHDAGSVVAVVQPGTAELTARLALEDVTGRFPRRNTEASLAARVPLASRLLIEGHGSGRYDNGAGEIFHEYRGVLTWFGRRLTLPRAGRSAERAVALARSATHLGEYELYSFDPETQREQRQRLALSPRREELREEMTAVYRAEVEERQVPLLGVAYRDLSDSLSGETVRAAGVRLGVPWPPALPWRAAESSVRFLELAYEHEWHTTASSALDARRSGVDTVSLAVALNRDMDLLVTWSHAEPTALDVIRGIGVHDRFAASVVYARGR